ncbi:MAG: RNA polymerase sigma factor [Lachnospiraceae bacterium]|nr:RNA polymerase sigma factor [Lachnospiraceae bacterium]
MAVIDHKTFEKQIRKSLPNLYRLAFGILHNRADAEDAVSETLLRAYEKLHTLRKADHFHAWLMQIAANEAKTILLYFYERLSIPEIAKALHISQGTVKSRLSRGKKLLREKLSDH